MKAEVNYQSAHIRVYKSRGAARQHECLHCGNRADQWAFDHVNFSGSDMVRVDEGLNYSLDPGHYIPLCRTCHRRFDMALVTHCRQGHPFEGDNLVIQNDSRKCRTCRAISALASRARHAATLREDPDDPRHRTARGYRLYSCRCDLCRAAGSAADRARYWAKRAAPSEVPA